MNAACGGWGGWESYKNQPEGEKKKNLLLAEMFLLVLFE